MQFKQIEFLNYYLFNMSKKKIGSYLSSVITSEKNKDRRALF